MAFWALSSTDFGVDAQAARRQHRPTVRNGLILVFIVETSSIISSQRRAEDSVACEEGLRHPNAPVFHPETHHVRAIPWTQSAEPSRNAAHTCGIYGRHRD